MRRYVFASVRMAIVTMVLLGVIYPLTVTGLAQAAFPRQAGGSLVTAGGRVVGSALIGQTFTSPRYFHGRPSAAGTGYDPATSGASNLGPTSSALAASVKERAAAAIDENPGLTIGAVPVDMVTASGSGLDPDITVANARAQAARVAQARRMTENEVDSIIDLHAIGRQFGWLGEPRVNVLTLNLELDAR